MNKPYYQDEAVTIYHGDCLDILPCLAPVDLALTDPDYNSDTMLYESESAKLSEEDYKVFCGQWFDLVSQNTGRIVFTPGIMNMWNYPQPRWIVIWYKPASVCKSRVGGFNVWEPIYIYGDVVCRFGHDLLNYAPLNFSRMEWEREHPCPKQPELWAVLLARTSKLGELILDPFMGSGTTLRVAKNLGRRAIGIEREEKYCELAAKRMSQTVMDLSAGMLSPQDAAQAAEDPLEDTDKHLGNGPNNAA